jgi:hypothetical protein
MSRSYTSSPPKRLHGVYRDCFYLSVVTEKVRITAERRRHKCFPPPRVHHRFFIHYKNNYEFRIGLNEHAAIGRWNTAVVGLNPAWYPNDCPRFLSCVVLPTHSISRCDVVHVESTSLYCGHQRTYGSSLG